MSSKPRHDDDVDRDGDGDNDDNDDSRPFKSVRVFGTNRACWLAVFEEAVPAAFVEDELLGCHPKNKNTH